MAEKHYESDWAKAKARYLQKGMVEETLLKFKKPSELKVLCLPGIDAAEVFQVYDPLDIPRENVTGVERERDIADEIESKGLGIELCRGSIEDYISEKNATIFDVASLDFIGPITEKQFYMMRNLINKQRNNYFVLHTCNLLRRDNKTLPLYHFSYSTNLDAEKNCPIFSEGQIRALTERSNHFLNKIKSGSTFMPEKGSAYISVVKASFSNSSYSAYSKIFNFLTGVELTEILGGFIQEAEKTTGKGIRLDKDKVFSSLEWSPLLVVLPKLLENVVWGYLKQECDKNGLKEEHFQRGLWLALKDISNSSKVFRAKDADSYSYISESGAPMIGTLHYLVHPRRSINAAKKIGEIINFPEKFKLGDKKQLIALYKGLKKYAQEEEDLVKPQKVIEVADKSNNVVFLGNSSKPVLTKERAIEEFRNGATVDELKKRYRCWESKPLSQWKAHLTMGTYDKKETVAEEDRDIETITKEEAIDLMNSGIPVNEIFEAFPTSFSPAQLRAFKAHHTMGTYAEAKQE